MIELEKIALKNIIVHKNNSLDIKPGITVIRGQNGSGKSLLLNCIPNVFDGCPPLLKKKDAKAIHSGNSAIGIKYKFNNDEYKVSQICNKNSLTYKISKNDEELDPRTSSIAKEYLEKIFPISTSQYYSLVHLTPYRASVLLSGTGPQRKEFFEELFHLNISENTLESVKAQLNILKRNQDEKDILTNRLKDLTFVEDIDKLKEEYVKIDEEHKTLDKQYQEYSKNIQIITSISTYRSQLKSGLSENEVREKLESFNKKLKELESQKQEIDLEILKYQENQENIKKKKNLEEQLKQYSNIKESSEIIKENYQDLKQTFTDIKTKMEEAEENNKQFFRFVELDNKLPNDYKKYQNYEELVSFFSTRESEKNKNQALINKLSQLEGQAVCPTCNQELNQDDLKNLISNCQKQNIKIDEELVHKDIALSWYKLKEKNLTEIDIDRVSKDLEKIREKLTQLKDSYEKAKSKEALQIQLENFPQFLQLSEPDIKELDKIKESIEKGKNKIKILESDLTIYEKLNQIDLSKFENQDISTINSEMETLAPKIKELNEKRMEMNTKINLGESQNTQYKKIEKQIEDLETSLLDMPIYEALVKAYGAKGIKIDQIEYLASMFCSNLNKYANLVYNKEIKFSVNVDSTNFNIFAERNGRQISDVCLLSGAESRSFMLLCALSLLPFIPEKYRTDYIVLDEIEAGMKSNTRKFITQGFFKALQNIVKKIIVITPMDQNEFYIESDNEYDLKLVNNETIMEKVR